VKNDKISSKTRATNFNKITSIAVLLCFLFSQVSWAIPATPFDAKSKPEKRSTNLSELSTQINIPSHLGRISERYSGGKSGFIVHIQDAHTHYEAQQNNAAIIERLINDTGMKLILVEGGVGNVDLAHLRNYAIKRDRIDIAEKYLKDAMINGAEYLEVTSRYPMVLEGIEDPQYYLDNRNVFLQIQETKSRNVRYLNAIKSVIDELKGHLYHKALKNFESRRIDFSKGTISTTDYCEYLSKIARKTKVDLSDCETLTAFDKLCQFDNEIDFDAVSKERDLLVRNLTAKLTKDDLGELLASSLEFKSANISEPDYYKLLFGFCKKTNSELTAYKNLVLYEDYISISDSIDPDRFFDEITSVENLIKDKLFKDKDQRFLDKAAGEIELLSEFFELKLRPQDFSFYQANKEGFLDNGALAFLREKAARFNIPIVLPKSMDSLSSSLDKLESFYSLAQKRDEAFIKNTLSAMRTHKENAAVLIAGGFHTVRLTKMFREADLSYIVVAPTMTEEMDYDFYYSILTNYKPTFATTNEKEAGSIRLSSSFSQAAAVQAVSVAGGAPNNGARLGGDYVKITEQRFGTNPTETRAAVILAKEMEENPATADIMAALGRAGVEDPIELAVAAVRAQSEVKSSRHDTLQARNKAVEEGFFGPKGIATSALNLEALERLADRVVKATQMADRLNRHAPLKVLMTAVEKAGEKKGRAFGISKVELALSVIDAQTANRVGDAGVMHSARKKAIAIFLDDEMTMAVADGDLAVLAMWDEGGMSDADLTPAAGWVDVGDITGGANRGIADGATQVLSGVTVTIPVFTHPKVKFTVWNVNVAELVEQLRINLMNRFPDCHVSVGDGNAIRLSRPGAGGFEESEEIELSDLELENRIDYFLRKDPTGDRRRKVIRISRSGDSLNVQIPAFKIPAERFTPANAYNLAMVLRRCMETRFPNSTIRAKSAEVLEITTDGTPTSIRVTDLDNLASQVSYGFTRDATGRQSLITVKGGRQLAHPEDRKALGYASHPVVNQKLLSYVKQPNKVIAYVYDKSRGRWVARAVNYVENYVGRDNDLGDELPEYDLTAEEQRALSASLQGVFAAGALERINVVLGETAVMWTGDAKDSNFAHPAGLNKIWKGERAFRDLLANPNDTSGNLLRDVLAHEIKHLDAVTPEEHARVDKEPGYDALVQRYAARCREIDARRNDDAKAIGGAHASHWGTNERLKDKIRHEGVLDYKREGNEWVAYWVDYIADYDGTQNDTTRIAPDEYQLSQEEQDTLNAQTPAEIRSIRTVLGETAVMWTGDIDHSQLIHAGNARHGRVWHGEYLFRQMLADAGRGSDLLGRTFAHEAEHMDPNADHAHIDGTFNYVSLVGVVNELRSHIDSWQPDEYAQARLANLRTYLMHLGQTADNYNMITPAGYIDRERNASNGAVQLRIDQAKRELDWLASLDRELLDDDGQESVFAGIEKIDDPRGPNRGPIYREFDPDLHKQKIAARTYDFRATLRTITQPIMGQAEERLISATMSDKLAFRLGTAAGTWMKEVWPEAFAGDFDMTGQEMWTLVSKGCRLWSKEIQESYALGLRATGLKVTMVKGNEAGYEWTRERLAEDVAANRITQEEMDDFIGTEELDGEKGLPIKVGVARAFEDRGIVSTPQYYFLSRLIRYRYASILYTHDGKGAKGIALRAAARFYGWCAAVTGSHNPREFNGLKQVIVSLMNVKISGEDTIIDYVLSINDKVMQAVANKIWKREWVLVPAKDMQPEEEVDTISPTETAYIHNIYMMHRVRFGNQMWNQMLEAALAAEKPDTIQVKGRKVKFDDAPPEEQVAVLRSIGFDGLILALRDIDYDKRNWGEVREDISSALASLGIGMPADALPAKRPPLCWNKPYAMLRALSARMKGDGTRSGDSSVMLMDHMHGSTGLSAFTLKWLGMNEEFGSLNEYPDGDFKAEPYPNKRDFLGKSIVLARKLGAWLWGRDEDGDRCILYTPRGKMIQGDIMSPVVEARRFMKRELERRENGEGKHKLIFIGEVKYSSAAETYLRSKCDELGWEYGKDVQLILTPVGFGYIKDAMQQVRTAILNEDDDTLLFAGRSSEVHVQLKYGDGTQAMPVSLGNELSGHQMEGEWFAEDEMTITNMCDLWVEDALSQLQEWGFDLGDLSEGGIDAIMADPRMTPERTEHLFGLLEDAIDELPVVYATPELRPESEEDFDEEKIRGIAAAAGVANTTEYLFGGVWEKESAKLLQDDKKKDLLTPSQKAHLDYIAKLAASALAKAYVDTGEDRDQIVANLKYTIAQPQFGLPEGSVKGLNGYDDEDGRHVMGVVDKMAHLESGAPLCKELIVQGIRGNFLDYMRDEHGFELDEVADEAKVGDRRPDPAKTRGGANLYVYKRKDGKPVRISLGVGMTPLFVKRVLIDRIDGALIYFECVDDSGNEMLASFVTRKSNTQPEIICRAEGFTPGMRDTVTAFMYGFFERYQGTYITRDPYLMNEVMPLLAFAQLEAPEQGIVNNQASAMVDDVLMAFQDGSIVKMITRQNLLDLGYPAKDYPVHDAKIDDEVARLKDVAQAAFDEGRLPDDDEDLRAIIDGAFGNRIATGMHEGLAGKVAKRIAKKVAPYGSAELYNAGNLNYWIGRAVTRQVRDRIAAVRPFAEGDFVLDASRLRTEEDLPATKAGNDILVLGKYRFRIRTKVDDRHYVAECLSTPPEGVKSGLAAGQLKVGDQVHLRVLPTENFLATRIEGAQGRDAALAGLKRSEGYPDPRQEAEVAFDDTAIVDNRNLGILISRETKKTIPVDRVPRRERGPVRIPVLTRNTPAAWLVEHGHVLRELITRGEVSAAVGMFFTALERYDAGELALADQYLNEYCAVLADCLNTANLNARANVVLGELSRAGDDRCYRWVDSRLRQFRFPIHPTDSLQTQTMQMQGRTVQFKQDRQGTWDGVTVAGEDTPGEIAQAAQNDDEGNSFLLGTHPTYHWRGKREHGYPAKKGAYSKAATYDHRVARDGDKMIDYGMNHNEPLPEELRVAILDELTTQRLDDRRVQDAVAAMTGERGVATLEELDDADLLDLARDHAAIGDLRLHDTYAPSPQYSMLAPGRVQVQCTGSHSQGLSMDIKRIEEGWAVQYSAKYNDAGEIVDCFVQMVDALDPDPNRRSFYSLPGYVDIVYMSNGARFTDFSIKLSEEEAIRLGIDIEGTEDIYEDGSAVPGGAAHILVQHNGGVALVENPDAEVYWADGSPGHVRWVNTVTPDWGRTLPKGVDPGDLLQMRREYPEDIVNIVKGDGKERFVGRMLDALTTGATEMAKLPAGFADLTDQDAAAVVEVSKEEVQVAIAQRLAESPMVTLPYCDMKVWGNRGAMNTLKGEVEAKRLEESAGVVDKMGANAAMEPAETYEFCGIPKTTSVAVTPDGTTQASLTTLAAADPVGIMGRAVVEGYRSYNFYYKNEFPWIIKFIATGGDISTQAHMNSELWVIAPGTAQDAYIYIGFKPGISRDEFERDSVVALAINILLQCVRPGKEWPSWIDEKPGLHDLLEIEIRKLEEIGMTDGALQAQLEYLDMNEKYLNRVPVKVGDAFVLENGTPHVIGTGCVISEIKESEESKTYRAWDQNRPALRELDVLEIGNVANFDPEFNRVENFRAEQEVYYDAEGVTAASLARLPYANVDSFILTEGTRFGESEDAAPITTTGDRFHALVVLRGSVTVQLDNGEVVTLNSGYSTYVAPGHHYTIVGRDAESEVLNYTWPGEMEFDGAMGMVDAKSTADTLADEIIEDANKAQNRGTDHIYIDGDLSVDEQRKVLDEMASDINRWDPRFAGNRCVIHIIDWANFDAGKEFAGKENVAVAVSAENADRLKGYPQVRRWALSKGNFIPVKALVALLRASCREEEWLKQNADRINDLLRQISPATRALSTDEIAMLVTRPEEFAAIVIVAMPQVRRMERNKWKQLNRRARESAA